MNSAQIARLKSTQSIKNLNRRRTPRRKPRDFVWAECRESVQGPDLATTLLDISRHGIRLVITQSLDQGTEVQIILGGHSGSRIIKRIGSVRWQVKLDN